MAQESVQCDGCECINMSMAQYVNFSQPHLQFFCRQCVSSRDGYNFLAALSHIAQCVPDVTLMRSRAESELNLPQFYGIALPVVQSVDADNLPVHTQSVELLQDHSSWYVAGDGNCLFRAVSMLMTH